MVEHARALCRCAHVRRQTSTTTLRARARARLRDVRDYGYETNTDDCVIAWRCFPCETEPPAVAHVNTWLRALCVVGAVLGTVEGARAQAPGMPVSEGTFVLVALEPASAAGRRPQSVSTTAPMPIKLTLGAERSAELTPGDTGLRLPPPAPLTATPVQNEHSGWSPTLFWIAASATIVTASLGGFQALHVKDLYDQANGIPVVSPERNALHDQMQTAEVTADALLVGSVVLAIGTTILAFQIDWSGDDRPRDPVARLPPSAAARRGW